MTPTFTRNWMTLALTFVGVVFLAWGVDEDPMARRMVLGFGMLLLAYVYAQLTAPRGRD